MSETVKLTIDGNEVEAPRGSLIIRVAEQLDITIPRFCDHPLLAPAGACRQCLVEVAGQRKPVAACTTTVAEGMVVNTQRTSEVARKAQEGVMEFLLINHPLDCPVCDKGGECPLQNQAMSAGRPDTRFLEEKRQYAKPLAISSQVLLDRERCVLCQRCTRFSDEIAGDPFISLMARSSDSQIGVFGDVGVYAGGPRQSEGRLVAAERAGRVASREAGEHGEAGESCGQCADCSCGKESTETGAEAGTGAGFEIGAPFGVEAELGAEPFNSYFSGNTVQICPVGALTGVQYRFRARPFDLVSVPTVCEHCAAGCAVRTDVRRNKVLRRLAGDDPAVNEEWNCDKGRWAYEYAVASDRITKPMVRDESGTLRETSWPDALRAAAEGLAAARTRGGVGVLTGGRLTVEDAYAYSRFARVALGTNDIDFRARPASAEEAEFLAASVAGHTEIEYSDIEAAPAVVLVGIEPEEECPILFLRLRKATRHNRLRVLAITPTASPGFDKLGATVVLSVPGGEPGLLEGFAPIREALAEPGALLIVGERLATVPGGLSAAAAVAGRTGARLAWVPRRAGDRGALEAGCLPNLLPGARPVTETVARAEIAQAWHLESGVLPSVAGRDATAILEAAKAGELGGLLVAGVDPLDMADPALAERALEAVGFLVSLELRPSAVTERANVVLPVAAVAEKAGSFIDWEGRARPFEAALSSSAMSDARVLDAIAKQMGVANAGTLASGARFADLGQTSAERPVPPTVAAVEPAHPVRGTAVLASWHQLIDAGSLSEGNEPLAGTARRPVARLSAATAAELDLVEGQPVTVSTERGSITLPVAVTEALDGVVWLPTNSPGSRVRPTLGVTEGAVVEISSGGGR